MKSTHKFLIIGIIAVLVLVIGVGIGSVFISPKEIMRILLSLMSNTSSLAPVDSTLESILLNLRLPRVFLAFLAGGALSISGVIMQSILRNPLASAYTIGVSSGAAVGASLVMLFNLSMLGSFTLPAFGLLFGLLTVFSAVSLSAKMDKNLGSTTIILTGMAFSYFANSLIAFALFLDHQNSTRIIFWQLGSFSSKNWTHILMLIPIILISICILSFFIVEMDLMTFGEETAQATGVNIAKTKWCLLGISAILAGSVISITGIIGFVDLFTPHIARKFFGSKHKLVLPASFLLGGIFMVLCDLISRSLISPLELPVGAVSSLIGAPFFIYLYFQRKKGVA